MTDHRPTDIRPYLEPAYWDGHTYGDTDARPQSDKVYGLRADKLVRRAGLDEMSNTYPLRTLLPGALFNARDHVLGTFVLMHEERLVFHRAPQPSENSVHCPLPERPNPENLRGVRNLRLHSPHASYSALLRGGIVATNTKTHEHELYDFGLAYWEPGCRPITHQLYRQPTPLVIGRTYHYRQQKQETLNRIGQLQIITEGGTWKRSPRMAMAAEWLSGLLPRPMTT
ncbi:MAG TPA: hypothetical protein VLE73_02800 [Candidatus Saccharimonadales bacterium]|nr:hypothetical protein [Candidatus Saccharimonadales bacterium]